MNYLYGICNYTEQNSAGRIKHTSLSSHLFGALAQPKAASPNRQRGRAAASRGIPAGTGRAGDPGSGGFAPAHPGRACLGAKSALGLARGARAPGLAEDGPLWVFNSNEKN